MMRGRAALVASLCVGETLLVSAGASAATKERGAVETLPAGDELALSIEGLAQITPTDIEDPDATTRPGTGGSPVSPV